MSKDVSKDVDNQNLEERLTIDSKNNEEVNGDEEYQDINTNTEKKSLWDRYFGKMGEGSIRGSIFNLIIMTVGSSALALAQRFSKMTLLVGIIDIALAASASLWAFNLLIITGLKYKIYDYSKLVKEIYGKTLGYVLDITIIIYVFGIITLYQVICNIFSNVSIQINW